MNKNLALLKVLADETRLKILSALEEKDLYVELLAERMQLSPATVSFHMKKLLASGLVDARREQYYTVYSIHREAFEIPLAALVFSRQDDAAAAQMREEMYRRKVLNTFMPDGVCRALPAQIKKRMIILEEMHRQFDPERTYSEREVNAIIGRMHEDFCTVRRALVGLGWMSRENGIYTVHAIGDQEE